jgi:hypothetical protein
MQTGELTRRSACPGSGKYEATVNGTDSPESFLQHAPESLSQKAQSAGNLCLAKMMPERLVPPRARITKSFYPISFMRSGVRKPVVRLRRRGLVDEHPKSERAARTPSSGISDNNPAAKRVPGTGSIQEQYAHSGALTARTKMSRDEAARPTGTGTMPRGDQSEQSITAQPTRCRSPDAPCWASL